LVEITSLGVPPCNGSYFINITYLKDIVELDFCARFLYQCMTTLDGDSLFDVLAKYIEVDVNATLGIQASLTLVASLVVNLSDLTSPWLMVEPLVMELELVGWPNITLGLGLTLL